MHLLKKITASCPKEKQLTSFADYVLDNYNENNNYTLPILWI